MEPKKGAHFPEGFLWGASISSMQTEGGIENNDWAEAERQGKTPKIGEACDFYHRYESDLDIAKSLNFNTFRFSVEWARVEPEEGVFDEKELQHYRRVMQAVRERGMEPFLCVWHFSLPLWFVKSGSFGRKDAPEIFARYAKKVAEVMGSDVRFYITMNEPMVWLGEQGRILKGSPGFSPNPFAGLYYMKQLQRAHCLAYKIIKSVNHGASVGIATHLIYFLGTNFFGVILAKIAHFFWNEMFLRPIRAQQDYIGVQFYQRISFWRSAEHRRTALRSDIGWHLHPDALEEVILKAFRTYKLPIIITENGVADSIDQHRTDFIIESLTAVYQAIQKGADVRGYLHWSLLDNYEFTHGYSMRFGLIEVNHETQERTVRESARMYAGVAGTNCLPQVVPNSSL